MCKKRELTHLDVPMQAPGSTGKQIVIPVDLSPKNPIFDSGKEPVLIDPLFQVSAARNSSNYELLSKYGITPYALTPNLITTLSLRRTLNNDFHSSDQADAMIRLQQMFNATDVLEFNDLKEDNMWHVWTIERYMRPVAITGAKLYYDNAQHAILHYMNVHENFRGTGIGSAILSYMNAHAALDTVLIHRKDFVSMSMLTVQYYYPIAKINGNGMSDILVMRRDSIGPSAGVNMDDLQIKWAIWVAQICQDGLFIDEKQLTKDNCIDIADRDNAIEVVGENSPYVDFLYTLTDDLDHAQMAAIIRRLIAFYGIDRVASKILDRAAWIVRTKNEESKASADERKNALINSIHVDNIEGCTLPNNYHLYGRDHYFGVGMPTPGAEANSRLLLRSTNMFNR